MLNKELYISTFVVLKASENTLSEVLKLTARKKRKLPQTILKAASFIILISALFTTALMTNFFGLRNTDLPGEIPGNQPLDYTYVADEELSFNARVNNWIRVPVEEGKIYKEEVLKLIDFSKTINPENDHYHLFIDNNLTQISEFYSLDKVSIENYKFGEAFITPTNFIYQYFLIQEKSETSYSRINITITRQDWVDTNLPDTDLLMDALENYDQGVVEITDDDMLYFKTSKIIVARLGRTDISIQAWGQTLSYLQLRELVLDIIEKADLIAI